MFTFNGSAKTIQITGVSTVEVKALYSAWKNWAAQGANLGYEQAFRTFGGDPTVSGQYAPAYYFLTNGWRVVLDGISVSFSTNLYTNEGVSPIVLLNGATVSLKNSDSPIVAADGGSGGAVDLTGIESTLANIQAALNNLDTSGITVDLSGVDTKLDNIQTSINTLDVSGGTVDLTAVNTKLDTIQTSVNNIPTTDLSGVTTSIAALQTSVNNIPTTDLSTVTAQLTAIQSSLSNLSVTTDLTEVTSRLDNLQASLSTLSVTTDLTEVTTLINNLQTSLSGLEVTTDLTGITTLLDTLQTSVDSISAAIPPEVEQRILEIWQMMGLDASNIQSVTDSSITVGNIRITITSSPTTTTLTRA